MKPDQQSLKKILLAVTLSASCYGLTHLIYVLTAPENSAANSAEPIAYTVKVSEEVQRRPVARMIWHLLNSGEPVYPGEAIRTSHNGDVRIQFVGTERILDLEADTMIVLTKKENEIALDLLDGNVFVAQNETSATPESVKTKLTLKSKKGSIDISRATANLSNSNGNVELQVLKGEALLESDGNKKSIKSGDATSKIQILEPAGDRPLFSTGLQSKSVRFKWQGATEGSSVELWLGNQRKNLIVQSKVTSSSTSEFRLDLKPGKYFWQLRSPTSGESQVQRFEILSLAPPQPLTPLSAHSLVLEKDPGSVEFSWSNPTGVQSTTLEISKDANFTQVIHTEPVPSSKSFAIKELGAGKFFWRVSGYYPEHQQMASSPIWNFESQIGAPRVTEVLWDEKTTSEKFFVEKPKLDFGWKEAETGRARSWLIRLASDEQELNNPASTSLIKIETQNQNINSLLPVAGRWVASIEGRDATGKAVSKSVVKEFQLRPLPLLKAPEFTMPEGDFKATPQGNLDLSWGSVEGATEYWLILKNPEGKEIQNKKFLKNSTALNNLMPGAYTLEIFAKDSHGRKSEPAPVRKILVPETSGLSAPKLRRVKVN